MALVKYIQISFLILMAQTPIPQLALGAGCLGAKGLGHAQAFHESLSALAREP